MMRITKDFRDQEFARRYIKNHDKFLRRLGSEYAQKLLKRKFVKGKMLDMGCGSGDMIIALALHFPACEVVGIDRSGPLLGYANKLKIRHHLNDQVKFINGDVRKLPFEDKSFDIVYNVNMVHLVDDPITMLNELNRVLKLGGHFFIKDLRYSWLRIFEDEIRNALKVFEAEELIRRSTIKGGKFSKSLLWWNFETEK